MSKLRAAGDGLSCVDGRVLIWKLTLVPARGLIEISPPNPPWEGGTWLESTVTVRLAFSLGPKAPEEGSTRTNCGQLTEVDQLCSVLVTDRSSKVWLVVLGSPAATSNARLAGPTSNTAAPEGVVVTPPTLEMKTQARTADEWFFIHALFGLSVPLCLV
jgi:hypothetical protein